MIDPIVEEIHKIREQYAAEFDFDVDAIFNDLREKQSESQRKIVSFTKDSPKSEDEKEAA